VDYEVENGEHGGGPMIT